MTDTYTDNVAEDTAPETETGGNEAFTLDDVEKRYFKPSDFASAQQLLVKINALKENGANVTTTYNPEENFPEGYGLGVIPLSERSQSGDGNIRTGVVLAAIPDPDLISQDEAGRQFMRENAINSFMTKVANTVRPRADGTKAQPPFTVKDFIEGGRRGESLKSFTALSGDFVKALRRKGLTFISATILRQCLSNKAFAENQFPGVDQTSWQHVIDLMIAKAGEKGIDPAIFVNWKNTRDEQEVAELVDVDFDDLVID